jgi:hypothetical protein
MFRVYSILFFRKETFNEAHFNYMREKAITQWGGMRFKSFTFLIFITLMGSAMRRMLYSERGYVDDVEVSL